MTTKELPQVKFTGEVFARVNQEVTPNGYVDTICRLGVGEAPEDAGTGADYVLALDGDDLKPRLATIGIERSEDDTKGHLIITAERDTLAQDPALLGVVCQAALEHAGVKAAFLNPERDSNLPAEAFQKAGAVALSESSFEFRAAA